MKYSAREEIVVFAQCIYVSGMSDWIIQISYCSSPWCEMKAGTGPIVEKDVQHSASQFGPDLHAIQLTCVGIKSAA